MSNNNNDLGLSVVGFHVAMGGNKNGFGDWLRDLNAAGVPVFVKGADVYGEIWEALQVGSEYGVANNLVYRPIMESPYDVPRYDQRPSDAASFHWAYVKTQLPPEFDKSRVWIEPLNEPRGANDPNNPNWGNMDAVDWLGEFSYYVGMMAIRDGYKVCLPSFNSGEPAAGIDGEPNKYEEPGMLQFLALCADDPNHVALSVHEYSWSLWKDGLSPYDWMPSLWGRCEAALAACDLHGISRNFNIFVTEFGWAHNDVPQEDIGLGHIEIYDMWAARWPQVKGAALWTLQAGWEGINDKLQKYIAPMSTYQSTAVFPRGEQPQMTFLGTLPENTEPPEPPNGGNNLLDNPEFLPPRQLLNGERDTYLPVGWNMWWADETVENPIDSAPHSHFQIPYSTPTGEYIMGRQHASWYGGLFQNVGVDPGHYEFRVTLAGHLLHNGQLPTDGRDARVKMRVDGIASGATGFMYLPPDGTETTYVFEVTVNDNGVLTVVFDIMCPFPLEENKVELIKAELIKMGDDGYTSLEEALIAESRLTQCIELNREAALMNAIMNDNFNVVSDEFYYTYRGIQYVYQTAESLRNNERRVYYVVVGDWNNVRYFVDDGGEGPGNPEPPDPPLPPGDGDAAMGVHASADSHNMPGDIELIVLSRPDMIKVLSSHAEADVRELARNSDATDWVIRAFLSFGGRNVTPRQFLEWTESDVKRTIAALVSEGIDKDNMVVELHNEPNLTTEGLGSTWHSAAEFNSWYLELLDLYRAALPDVRLIFPGLSPGEDISGLRISHREFMTACRDSINASDGLAIHSYWSPAYDMWTNPNAGIKLVDEAISMYPNKPIWITEACNNSGEVNEVTKAAEYIAFYNALLEREEVQGVTYFVLSASNPAWQWGGGGTGEVWTPTIATIIGDRV